jgi:MraZ protein
VIASETEAFTHFTSNHEFYDGLRGPLNKHRALAQLFLLQHLLTRALNFTMFRGQNNISIDAKGRITLPARYRDQVNEISKGKLIIATDSPECLLIYPYDTWLPIEEEIMRRPTIDPEVRELQRQLVGRASEQDMDSQGRVMMPPELREVAGLDKDVVLLGLRHRFELWDAAKWNAKNGVQPVTINPNNPNLHNLSW